MEGAPGCTRQRQIGSDMKRGASAPQARRTTSQASHNPDRDPRPVVESIEEVDLPQELSEEDEMKGSSKEGEEPATGSTGEKEEDTPGRANLNACSCNKDERCTYGIRKPPAEQYGHSRMHQPGTSEIPSAHFPACRPSSPRLCPSHPPTGPTSPEAQRTRVVEEKVNSHLARWTEAVHEARPVPPTGASSKGDFRQPPEGSRGPGQLPAYQVPEEMHTSHPRKKDCQAQTSMARPLICATTAVAPPRKTWQLSPQSWSWRRLVTSSMRT